MLRFAFFGSDEIALPALEAALAAGGSGACGGTGATVGRGGFACEIPLVVSQPDRPSGRGRELRANAVVQWARARGAAVLQPERAGAETVEALREHGCAAALVMAYGCILKRDLLDAPPLGVFNLHASLLPQFRGAAPIEAAIAAGLAETGVCLQRVVPRLDAGAVVDAERVPLAGDETRTSLRGKIAAACVPLLLRALPRIAAGDAVGVPQDEAAVSLVRKISRGDSGVDFAASAREIAARVRALSPWPGVTLPWDVGGGGVMSATGNGGGGNGVVLKIGEAVAEERDGDVVGGAGGGEFSARNPGEPPVPLSHAAAAVSARPGEVLAADADGLRIATGAGVLRVLQLQRPGGKMLPVGQFLSGFPIRAGHVFPSLPMPPLWRRAAASSSVF